ncbi:hypothetical protein POM88_014644 [Heracleum sosnowskyi]|uniref:DEK-C domain-containing protein n=1 Tax=Heracleum sosnowskyi TaxID=360622 RepID=A0AAD8IJ17_9APIA|nr:hypothetical protein POM88_014644 [Heracleum sosnowskyi]
MGKDPEKTVSKRKCRKEKPKVAEENTKSNKTVEKKKNTPASDHPICDVERLVTSIEKDSGKELHIEKGCGTALKDIPNDLIYCKEATKKRKRVTEAVEEKSPIPKKSTSKDIAGKKVLRGKEKKPKGEKLKPSDTELKNATCELLKEVDCNTATITDILKLLVKRFNTDLVPRKSTIRRIIMDEIKAKGEKLKPSDTELKNATCELLKELKPSDTELKNATCELLKEVDCKTATITDILKLLVKRFNTDLVPRISTITRIIMDEIKAKGEKLKPSDAELKNATCELLKEVDCKTATITDILKLLVKRFNTDLVPRKSTVRRIILDELTKMF